MDYHLVFAFAFSLFFPSLHITQSVCHGLFLFFYLPSLRLHLQLIQAHTMYFNGPPMSVSRFLIFIYLRLFRYFNPTDPFLFIRHPIASSYFFSLSPRHLVNVVGSNTRVLRLHALKLFSGDSQSMSIEQSSVSFRPLVERSESSYRGRRW